MKPVIMLSMICLFASAFVSGQENRAEDPYAIAFVRYCVSMESIGVHTGTTAKHLPGMGDRVGIALIKGFSDTELRNAQTVRHLLPVIRQAFESPQFISIKEDKKPDVTMFLLRYLEENTEDAHLKRDILELEKSLQEKTAASEAPEHR